MRDGEADSATKTFSAHKGRKIGQVCISGGLKGEKVARVQ